MWLVYKGGYVYNTGWCTKEAMFTILAGVQRRLCLQYWLVYKEAMFTILAGVQGGYVYNTGWCTRRLCLQYWLVYKEAMFTILAGVQGGYVYNTGWCTRRLMFTILAGVQGGYVYNTGWCTRRLCLQYWLVYKEAMFTILAGVQGGYVYNTGWLQHWLVYKEANVYNTGWCTRRLCLQSLSRRCRYASLTAFVWEKSASNKPSFLVHFTKDFQNKRHNPIYSCLNRVRLSNAFQSFQKNHYQNNGFCVLREILFNTIIASLEG